MSHRITTKTEIKDKSIAMDALKSKDWKFSDRGNSLYIESGPLARASVDLVSGVITGDTDFHNKDSLGSLNQAYGETLYVRQVEDRGGSVDSREVLPDGSIRLVVDVSFS